MPVRACVPTRARHHLWEERCALRPRLRAARWGERLPWCAERGRILMGGHGHCPHSCPPLATPPTPSSSFRRHSVARPRPTRSTQILSPWSRDAIASSFPPRGPAKPNGDRLVLWGYLPGRAGGRRRQAGFATGSTSQPWKEGGPPLGGSGQKKGRPRPCSSCLSMRSRQRPT